MRSYSWISVCFSAASAGRIPALADCPLKKSAINATNAAMIAVQVSTLTRRMVS